MPQDVLSPFDQRVRQPGHTGHFDAVRMVGAPRDELTQEDDFPVVLLYLDAQIDDPVVSLG